MAVLDEVDRDSNPADHLGDYRPELGDPYPATQEAHARQTQTLPGEVHRDPEEVRQDVARYGSTPHRGTLVRVGAAASWAPNGFLLRDGAQSFRLAESDPERSRLTVWNHSEGAVYLAPTPTRVAGFGALYLPGRDATTGLVHSRQIGSWYEVWLFTLPGFVAGRSSESTVPGSTVGADPAAGAEASVTVPAGQTWELESFAATLATDATVANRRVSLVVDDGTNQLARVVASIDQAASGTVDYRAAAGVAETSAVRTGVLALALPRLTLGPGYRVRTITGALQAGDNFGAPVLGYRVTSTSTSTLDVHVQVLAERYG